MVSTYYLSVLDFSKELFFQSNQRKIIPVVNSSNEKSTHQAKINLFRIWKKTCTHNGALILPENLIKFHVYFHFKPGLFENNTLKIKFANAVFLLICFTVKPNKNYLIC